MAAPASGRSCGAGVQRGTEVAFDTWDSATTAKIGDSFRTTVVQAIDIDDQPVLPDGTVVVGRVELVKSVEQGHLTGVMGVKFTHIQLPGAQRQKLDGILTSLRQDDRKRLVELAPKVSTGRKIDTVFIGQSSAGRASTLVGDDVAEDYSNSRLGAREATIVAGTQITMELAEGLIPEPGTPRTAQNSKARRIRVAHASVAAAQRALAERKYYAGQVDGQLGSGYGHTRQAIVRFQLDHGQTPTGDLDEETLGLLDVKLSARAQ